MNLMNLIIPRQKEEMERYSLWSAVTVMIIQLSVVIIVLKNTTVHLSFSSSRITAVVYLESNVFIKRANRNLTPSYVYLEVAKHHLIDSFMFMSVASHEDVKIRIVSLTRNKPLSQGFKNPNQSKRFSALKLKGKPVSLNFPPKSHVWRRLTSPSWTMPVERLSFLPLLLSFTPRRLSPCWSTCVPGSVSETHKDRKERNQRWGFFFNSWKKKKGKETNVVVPEVYTVPMKYGLVLKENDAC